MSTELSSAGHQAGLERWSGEEEWEEASEGAASTLLIRTRRRDVRGCGA